METEDQEKKIKKRSPRPRGSQGEGQYMAPKDIEDVKKRIADRCFTKSHVAAKMGLHRANFSQILSRQRKIYPGEVKKLLNILNN